jgi:hypothetical protein
MSADYSFTVCTSRRGDEETWCEGCIEYNTFFCYESEERYSDTVPHIITHDGNCVARHHAEDYFKCHITGDWYHTDDGAGPFEDTGEWISTDATDGLMVDDDGVYWEPENFPKLDEEAAQEAA